MEKPSEEAWESALHCLHYLYSIRESGITFRSDGNEIPVCYYDSGHLQAGRDLRRRPTTLPRPSRSSKKTRSPTLPIPNEGGLDYDTNDGS